MNYYNNSKSSDEKPLEHFERCECECGFQIKFPYKQNIICDVNEKIRQLRWTKKYLLPGIYIGFTEKHFLLLYESLVNVFADKVIFEQK